ncbi:nadh:ubiquinone oxidoreductase subunit [Diplodia corticola]|uniref:Nadh:ubiquinone oxidoreductase subunit n=1 Tax=Diplodia corticola TaxID=236234 RepID=A0A1J9S1X3_9PEZI|nr:nadh:ubiquinone oxidoreductase subunit [Diplodia corticola]OJD34575.1 nadh:ubiquinone oxidoreductase subunit [Diplodia corticola]
MAGDHHVLHEDPALVKYGNVGPNRYKYFRWTPRTAWISIWVAVAVPSVVGLLAYKTDVSAYAMAIPCGGTHSAGGDESVPTSAGGAQDDEHVWGRTLNSKCIEEQAVVGLQRGHKADAMMQGKYELRGKRRGDVIKEF